MSWYCSCWTRTGTRTETLRWITLDQLGRAHDRHSVNITEWQTGWQRVWFLFCGSQRTLGTQITQHQCYKSLELFKFSLPIAWNHPWEFPGTSITGSTKDHFGIQKKDTILIQKEVGTKHIHPGWPFPVTLLLTTEQIILNKQLIY